MSLLKKLQQRVEEDPLSHKSLLRTLGGAGSGNFNHSGRPGERGGSTTETASSNAEKASERANSTGNKKDHADAAIMHQRAQTAWAKKAKNAKNWRLAAEKNRYHAEQAKKHILLYSKV